MNGNPQVEEGYTQIANELMEALARIKLTPIENQVLMFVIRKTYGWKKKADNISISQIVEGTGASRRMVIYAVQNLESKKILLVKRDSARNEISGSLCHSINVIGINKHYNKWVVQETSMQYRKALEKRKAYYKNHKIKVVQEIDGSARNAPEVVQEEQKNSRFLAPTKEKTKETIQKKPPAPEIDISEPAEKKLNVVAFWCEEYQTAFRQKAMLLGKDTGLLKNIGKLLKTEDECRKVFRRYFADRDKFILKNGHNVATLIGRLTAYDNAHVSSAQSGFIDNSSDDTAYYESLERMGREKLERLKREFEEKKNANANAK